jgi:hypothetical protein
VAGGEAGDVLLQLFAPGVAIGRKDALQGGGSGGK